MTIGRWMSFIPPQYRRVALQAAQADRESVLITGATGSGKSGIARWIHQNSPRSMQPFVSLKPGTISSESILSAQSGTLFFSEFETLAPYEKEMLLHLIKYSTLPASASSHQTPQIVRARVIMSSLTPIDHLLSSQPQWTIQIPLLATREDEFEDITRGLLREIAHSCKKDHLQDLDESAWKTLKNHSWPGNLRELRNALSVAVTRAEGDVLIAQDLPPLSDPSMIDLHGSRAEFEQDLLEKMIALAKKEFISKPG
jgi:DNA-binding NtrC family response regulator